MRTISIQGFDFKSHSYPFNTAPLDGKTALVFVADDLGKTSITNLIEDLTTKVHAKFLKDTLPQGIRVFEHYPKHLDPLIEWQEVTFEVGPIHPKRSWLQKLFRTNNGPIGWVFVNPRWSPVPPVLQARLKAALV